MKCMKCGTARKVRTYRSLPCFLGWVSIDKPEDYCDKCIDIKRQEAIQELTDSFARSAIDPTESTRAV